MKENKKGRRGGTKRTRLGGEREQLGLEK